MECVKCGSQSNLEMYPLRWGPDDDAIGFVFICSQCQGTGDVKIKWILEDDTEEGQSQETH
jgi:hypothetical protein